MKHRLIILIFVLMVSPLTASTGANGPRLHVPAQFGTMSTSTPTYWFQVGARAASANGYGDKFGQPITGASVEIRILDQKLNHADTEDDYWVGVNLPNDAFVQAGYMEYPQYNSGHPSLFWEYFLPGTAKEDLGGFLGNKGNTAGVNGTWVKFTVMSSGTIWFAYANDQQLGQIDLSVSDSGGSGPYAVAESAQTYWADNILGPVEFRNLSYRDTAGAWHLGSAAVSLCCYGVTSATYSGVFPYGVESMPGQNNHWLAGSELPYTPEGQYLWPWYYVTVTSPVGSSTGSGWYVEGSEITPQAEQTVPIAEGQRYYLKGWTDGTYTASGFTADGNMTLSAVYVKQYSVTVTSALGSAYGSGWYDAGSDAVIGVKPTRIQANGILGVLGVRYTLAGWEGDYTGSVGPDGSSVIVANSPMTIHAEWMMSPGVILPTLVGVVIACVSITLLTLRRRTRTQYCLNCGHKLPSGSLFCLDCGHKQEK
jgi:hypothetical protein